MSGDLKTYFIKIFEKIDNSYQPIEFNEFIFKKYKKKEDNIAILDKDGNIEKFITE